MWPTARPMTTAEWICQRCGATNRKFVAATTRSDRDRCVTCGTRHAIAPGTTPVRWQARTD